METDVLDKRFYADDLAENAKFEAKMQGAMDRMSKASDNFQLTISTKRLRWYSQHLEAVERANHHCEWTKTASC